MYPQKLSFFSKSYALYFSHSYNKRTQAVFLFMQFFCNVKQPSPVKQRPFFADASARLPGVFRVGVFKAPGAVREQHKDSVKDCCILFVL